ncbi:MAG: hypothetical protein AB4040_09250 [Synechococcus sp.]
MTGVSQSTGPLRSVAIAIAWAVATAIALVLTNVVLNLTNLSYEMWIVFLVGPFLLGVMQWLVLRWFLPRAGWWVVLTIVGCGLGWVSALGLALAVASLADATSIYLPMWVPEELACGWVAAVGGVAIGLAQWLYLRRHLRQAAWWIVASAIGLAIGGGPNLCSGLAVYSAHNWPLTLAVGGLAGGLVKGGTMAWLLRKPKSFEGVG